MTKGPGNIIYMPPEAGNIIYMPPEALENKPGDEKLPFEERDKKIKI